MVLLLLLTSAALAQECEQETTTSLLYDELDKAQVAFINLELDQFAQATNTIEDSIPCLREPMPRHLAAELHRLTGLRSAMDRAPMRTTRAFAAARSIEPEYRFPVEMVPEGSPVLLDYETISLENGEFADLPTVTSGTLRLDGRPGNRRPMSWPTIGQYLDSDGGVQWTAYLWPDDEMPAYEGSREGTNGSNGNGTDPLQIPDPPQPPTKRPIPLAISAAGAGLLAGGLFLGAEMNRRQFEDTNTPDDDLQRLRGRTNSLVMASAVTGGVALGLGVAVVFNW